MALEISGKIFLVLPAQEGQGTNGPWVKQSFVIETSDKFPKKICFQAWKDKVEIVSRLKPGDEVKVSVDLESREYQGKWYTDAKAWKIEVQNQTNATSTPEQVPTFSNEEAPPPVSDDLPF